jgi:hypothetical protein
MQPKEGEYETVLSLEPWRQRVGLPQRVTDPLWTPTGECGGEVRWEGSSKFWHCQKCGYIGWGTSQRHYPSEHPYDSFNAAFEFFLSEKKAQGLSEDRALKQAHFVMSVVLRHAADKKLDALKDFAEAITRL